jgi:hypothetical protein
MNRLTWLAAPLAALALAGCGGDDEDPASEERPPAAQTTTAPTTTEESGGAAPAPSEAEARVGAEREGTQESPVYELTAEGGEWKVSGNCAREPGCMEAFGAG